MLMLMIVILVLIILLIKWYPVYKVILLFLMKLFLPFLLAAFISYVLYPVVLKLHTFGISKGFAVIIIYVLFFASIAIIFYKSFPVFIGQLQDLSEQLPYLVTMYEDTIYSAYESTSFLPEIVHDKMDDFIIHMELSIEKQIEHILEKAENMFDFIILLTIIPVLVFYFLKDFTQMKRWFKQVMTKKHGVKLEKVIKAIHESLGGYVRGQLLISSAITLLTFIIYYTLQLKYALLLAIIMGLMNIIPYFGPLIGTIPAALIAATVSYRLVMIVLAANIVVQVLESSFLSPYIMGKSVRMHPVVIIFALLLGAELGGLVGMIVTVPLLTITRAIVVQFFLKKQQCN